MGLPLQQCAAVYVSEACGPTLVAYRRCGGGSCAYFLVVYRRRTCAWRVVPFAALLASVPLRHVRLHDLSLRMHADGDSTARAWCDEARAYMLGAAHPARPPGLAT